MSDLFLPLRPSHTIEEPHMDCPVCKDEALPARVLTLDVEANLATVMTACGEREVALDLVDDVQTGDYLLVHLGTAIAKLNPQDVIED